MRSRTELSLDPNESTSEMDEESLPPFSGVSSERAKLVLLYLHVNRRADVSELAVVLDLTQLSLYPTLDELTRHGFVDRAGSTYTLA